MIILNINYQKFVCKSVKHAGIIFDLLLETSALSLEFSNGKSVYYLDELPEITISTLNNEKVFCCKEEALKWLKEASDESNG